MAYDTFIPATLALMGGFMLILGLIALGVYAYTAIALMTIARKTKNKNGWMAWIPIANVYLMTQIAKVPGWVTLAVLLAFIPLGGLIFLAVSTWLWWKIAERRKLPGWIALLMLIPIVNLVIIGIIARKD